MSNYRIETGASPDQGFSARQQARIARRARVAERERRFNDAMLAVAGAIMTLAAFYLGCVWAGM